MAYLIRASEREAFKRCRRAWDFGSRNRQNLELIDPAGSVDLEQAVRDALAVYYFPGMWEWKRAIVQPLVHQALEKSVRGQVGGDTTDTTRTDSTDDPAVQEVLSRGHALLDAYAAWASTVDRFTPIRVQTDFEVNVPDPAAPGVELLTPDGEPIRYTDRVDLLAVDDDDAYWVIQHRIVHDSFADDENLQLDERTVAWCWAWPLFYLGMRVVGTMYNEIRADSGAPGVSTTAAERIEQPRMRHRRMYARTEVVPRERVRAEGTDEFRRTRIPRSDAELAVAGANLAAEARAVTSHDLQIYPSPGPEICAHCAYTAPCLVLTEGGDVEAELTRWYRQREPEKIEEGRLGGVSWSMNRGAAPPRWPRQP
jgi:hypothetical protein